MSENVSTANLAIPILTPPAFPTQTFQHRRSETAVEPHVSRDVTTLPARQIEAESSRWLYFFAKRALDIAVAGTAILVLSPLLILIVLAIRLTSRGPAIYKHTRVGLRGREFTCYKFRSMVNKADLLKQQLSEQNQHADSRTFKMVRDPRITFVGRILRKSSFDEMPQLFNVLRGEMSLVGPRPPVPSEVEQYSWDDLRRLEAKPGLTCIWQVSGRSKIPFPKQLQMDLDYIERQSMLLDVKLLLQTVPAVLTADGAY